MGKLKIIAAVICDVICIICIAVIVSTLSWECWLTILSLMAALHLRGKIGDIVKTEEDNGK